MTTLSNAISVGELLVKRGIKLDPCCQACGFEGESINHILFTCHVARQVWALANVPSPSGGFDLTSHYSNIHYLFSLGSNKSIPNKVRNALPWITWFLWKNRNNLMFEGKQSALFELVENFFVESEMWSLAQVEEEKEDLEERGDGTACQKRWVPPRGWFKCNIGVDWMKGTRLGGGAWVLRDEKGKVILHGRRAFSEIGSFHDAKLQVLVWLVESIISHHQNKVIFALDDGT
ncbi:uncharacterized protein LOC106417551 [Brassica napus]|uniref:uncharacterized protein LOC106417551 n=1 Tax=Brassica napus TaxID=3708 RepID=UPI0006AAD742|nr:uncharacterized protein LOC106417551 [Brassica napus]